MSDHIPSNSFHGGKGIPLSGVLAGSTAWERTVVPIGGNVRRVAWALTVLSGALAVAGVVLRNTLVDTATPGFFLVGWPWVDGLVALSIRLVALQVVSTAVLLALCVLTAGFREGGRRVQLTLGAGLAVAVAVLLLPTAALAIVAINLAVWVAIGAVCLAIVVVLIAGLLDS